MSPKGAYDSFEVPEMFMESKMKNRATRLIRWLHENPTRSLDLFGPCSSANRRLHAAGGLPRSRSGRVQRRDDGQDRHCRERLSRDAEQRRPSEGNIRVQ